MAKRQPDHRALVRRLFAASTVAAVSTLAGAVVPSGVEFQVNTYTIQQQHDPSVAMDAGGSFVVVWRSLDQDAGSNGVFARRFSSTGAPLAAEFMVNAFTANGQEAPAAAMNAGGDFLVAWTSYLQDGANRGIFGRRFSSAGSGVGLEFQINERTTSSQRGAAASISDDGSFVVTWASQASGTYDIVSRRFSSLGESIGADFLVNSYTEMNQFRPAISQGAAGELVAVWASSTQDGSSFGIFAQRFSNAGSRVGGEFQVNAYTSGSQYFPSAAVAPDGTFVIAWESPHDGGARGIFARRFDDDGQPTGLEFQVNLVTAAEDSHPRVAMDRGGDFVIAWHAERDGSNYGSFARQFLRTGTALGGEFQLNSRTALPQVEPVLARDSHGGFVAAWGSVQHDGPDPGNIGVFAQRFVGPLLDIDGNGRAEALTDGLLVLRHRFGFTEAALIGGAVDLVDCTRCTAPAIESRLAILDPLLDVDGDGERDALIDGLLVLRWLFGFTSTTLVNGAVDADCTRCTEQPISDYLATLGP